MKSKSLTSIARISRFALGLFFAFASSGYAADVLYHASLCNPIPSQVGQALYDQWGVANGSASQSLVINCGAGVSFSAIGVIEEVDVVVYDRHPSQNVSCTLRTVRLDGTASTTSFDSSSGSFGPSQFLVLEPLGSTILTTTHLQCTIPPWSPTGGFSHVTTYRVISTP